LEGYVWDSICAALLDPDQLQEGLAAARAEHDSADQQRQRRIQTLDRELATLRTRLEKVALQRLDAETGGELDAVLLKASRETEAQIQGLQSARNELAALCPAGLSSEEALSLETFAAKVQAGMTTATPDERRNIYRLLSLRIRLQTHPQGVLLGRKHRYLLQ
jgi:hypothetical protein